MYDYSKSNCAVPWVHSRKKRKFPFASIEECELACLVLSGFLRGFEYVDALSDMKELRAFAEKYKIKIRVAERDVNMDDYSKTLYPEIQVQKTIASLSLQGKTDKQIASILGISANLVKQLKTTGSRIRYGYNPTVLRNTVAFVSPKKKQKSKKPKDESGWLRTRTLELVRLAGSAIFGISDLKMLLKKWSPYAPADGELTCEDEVFKHHFEQAPKGMGKQSAYLKTCGVDENGSSSVNDSLSPNQDKEVDVQRQLVIYALENLDIRKAAECLSMSVPEVGENRLELLSAARRNS